MPDKATIKKPARRMPARSKGKPTGAYYVDVPVQIEYVREKPRPRGWMQRIRGWFRGMLARW